MASHLLSQVDNETLLAYDEVGQTEVIDSIGRTQTTGMLRLDWTQMKRASSQIDTPR